MGLAFPTNPSVDQVYTYGYSSWRWDGYAWNACPSAMLQVQIVASEVSVSAPLTGNYEGKIWYNSDEGKFYIYYQDKWIGVG